MEINYFTKSNEEKQCRSFYNNNTKYENCKNVRCLKRSQRKKYQIN